MIEVEVNLITVDDFTGEEIKKNGWALMRLVDGKTIHFQAISSMQNARLAEITAMFGDSSE